MKVVRFRFALPMRGMWGAAIGRRVFGCAPTGSTDGLVAMLASEGTDTGGSRLNFESEIYKCKNMY